MNQNAHCIAHLEAGGLLLAPDLRQARIWRRLHDRAQAESGRAVWPTAQVLPLDAWLAQQWRQAASDRPELPAILSPIALRWLWRRQVAGDAPGLLDPGDLGVRARASWLRLRAHGGDVTAISRWPMTRDQQAFFGWARSVEDDLKARRACDAGDLARLLVETSALSAAGPPILLAGFRRQTPAEEALFGALAAAGRRVERLVPSSHAGACFRHRAPDPEFERRSMLAWLHARLAFAPAGIHAVIVPDLDAARGSLERALAAVLQPELELPGTGSLERSFDLAGGHPLGMQPVVDAALGAVACAIGVVDWSVASRLLRSAYLDGAEAERGARVVADLSLREAQGPVQIDGPRLSDRAAKAGASRFASAARAAAAALEGSRGRSAADWAEAFGACLASWGWPGESGLGSREYQAARRFREILGELATLSAVATNLSAVAALGELRRMAAAPFQPESGEPAVFVLDAYDDPGVQFDSLWVAGMTAVAWPRPVAVDPLLPIEMQRRLAMPGVTPEGCVAEAREVIGRWRARAKELVLSWPQFENDTEADATPLLPLDSTELRVPATPPSRERMAFDLGRLEPVPEAPLPALAAAPVRGGARLLELQAQCAFRAFAELRLGASELAEPQAGLDRRLRGIVLHRALQELWGRFGSQQSLAMLDGAVRNRFAADAIDAAIADSAPAGTGAALIALEREWQLQAVCRMLELDLARPPFEVIETERALKLVIAGLELKLRVDRVDRIGEERIVIDYKTGRVQSSAWRGARMDAPQLPLYAVLHPARPGGIAFAAIGAADAKYVGVSRTASSFDGLEPAEKFRLTEDKRNGFAWPVITAHWRAWLERLAGDFAGGRTEVDPKHAADTCRHCHLAALCRVEAASPEDVEDEANDAD